MSPAMLEEIPMTSVRTPGPATNPVVGAQGRQILFYAPSGLLGGTFTCSRCGASGQQPDLIGHGRECSYALPLSGAGR
jgi:hypothetical protein